MAKWNPTPNQFDVVAKPAHYNAGSIECIDYIKSVLSPEEYIGYLRGNAIKYQHRCRYKGKTTEDLKKAQWYLAKLVEEFDGMQEGPP